MKNEPDNREWLSALADGEAHGQAFVRALDYAATDQGREDWHLYHVIGETLREGRPSSVCDGRLLVRLRDQLAREQAPPREAVSLEAVEPFPAVREAANASVWRWKMTAGLASLAAVAALGWDVYLTLGQAPQGAVMAQAAPAAPLVLAHNPDADRPAVMLRDPRLDELMAAHRQYGATAALQMPAEFLRNANFETRKR